MEINQGKELFESVVKMKKAMMKFHISAGMPQPAMMALRAIKNSSCCIDDNTEGIKTSEISKILRVTKPAITQMINDLEKKGFVERRLTKNDRRVVYVCLTNEGKEALEKIEEKMLCMIGKITDNLGEDDTNNLVRIINRLAEIIPTLYKNED